MTNGCCPCLRQTSDDDGSASTKKKKPKPKPKPEPEPKPNPFAEDMAESIHVLKNVISLRRNGLKDKYSLGEELGRGEFGITYLCTDRQTDEKLACKSISKKKLRTAVDVEDVRREVTIMASLPDHPNIVRLRAAYEDAEAVYLIMELCHGGELFDRISSRGRYEEREAAVIFRTIIEVVRTCHDHGVIHRDLKPENFLFENGREDSALKAIDFGLSVFFLPGERLSEIVGSPFYMAPEVFKRSYGPEIDVWSAGVILYILLSGVPPFWAGYQSIHPSIHLSIYLSIYLYILLSLPTIDL